MTLIDTVEANVKQYKRLHRRVSSKHITYEMSARSILATNGTLQILVKRSKHEDLHSVVTFCETTQKLDTLVDQTYCRHFFLQVLDPANLIGQLSHLEVLIPYLQRDILFELPFYFRKNIRCGKEVLWSQLYISSEMREC